MSLTNSKLSVEQITPDSNVTYFVTLQAATTGKSAVDYVSPLLTYNTGLGKFFVNNRIVPTSNVVSLGSVVTSPTPPPSPAVGDLWYDTTSDTQFEYVYDGVNYQWVDVTGPTMSIGGPVSTNNFTYLPFTATANPITSVTGEAGVSVNFSTFTSVSGGYTFYPYTYYIASGSLPSGLTLNSSTGVVSGFARASSSNVVFGVRDVVNNSVTSPTVSFSITLTIQYLVVAGGGGGGRDRGGGGGAGGLLFGTASNLPAGGVLNLTVGIGGAGGSTPVIARGVNGSASNLTAPNIPGFNNALTTGGGGGGTVNAPVANAPGQSGGSGGGGGGQPIANNPSSGGAGTAGIATGSPGVGVAGPQGYPGGIMGSASCSLYGAGGGGGAGAVGGNGVASPKAGGPGGNGYLWPITNLYYAGGGGGSFSCPGPGTVGAGGLGGGGPGANSGIPGTAGTQGTNGLGGGGGGGAGGSPAAPGGSGGSGTIILAMPTVGYPGSAPGATVTTPPAAPGITVLTYVTPTPLAPSVYTFTI